MVRGGMSEGFHEGRPYEGVGGEYGSPHPRGQREGCGDGEGVNVREGGPRGEPLREVGWGASMGPRIREDNGRGAGMVRV